MSDATQASKPLKAFKMTRMKYFKLFIFTVFFGITVYVMYISISHHTSSSSKSGVELKKKMLRQPPIDNYLWKDFNCRLYKEGTDLNLEIPKDRRKDKTRLRIVNWNVEWLFLDSKSDFEQSNSYGKKQTNSMECPGSDCPWKVAHN